MTDLAEDTQVRVIDSTSNHWGQTGTVIGNYNPINGGLGYKVRFSDGTIRNYPKARLEVVATHGDTKTIDGYNFVGNFSVKSAPAEALGKYVYFADDDIPEIVEVVYTKDGYIHFLDDSGTQVSTISDTETVAIYEKDTRHFVTKDDVSASLLGRKLTILRSGLSATNITVGAFSLDEAGILVVTPMRALSLYDKGSLVKYTINLESNKIAYFADGE